MDSIITATELLRATGRPLPNRFAKFGRWRLIGDRWWLEYSKDGVWNTSKISIKIGEVDEGNK